MKTNTFSIIEAVKYGFVTLQKHWKTLAAVWGILALFALSIYLGMVLFGIISFNAMPTLFSSFSSGSFVSLFGQSSEVFTESMNVEVVKIAWQSMNIAELFFSLVWVLLFIFFSSAFGVIVQLVNAYIALKIYDTDVVCWRDIFNVQTLFFTALSASVLYMFGVLCGTILLIVPGIILYVRWIFFMYAVVDGKGSAFECLKHSFEITRGNMLCIIGLMVTFGLLSFPFSVLIKTIHQSGIKLAPMLFVIVIATIGQMIVSAAGMLSYAYVYRKLSDIHTQEVLVDNK